MKKLFPLLFLISSCLLSSAQEHYLTDALNEVVGMKWAMGNVEANETSQYIIFQNQDSRSNVSFDDLPKLVLADGNWVLETVGEECQMTDVRNILFRPSIKGDANLDEAVDVADITTQAAYILGDQPKEFFKETADVNKDGVIDVADITATALIILSKPSN